MTPERWQRIKAVFEKALELPSGKRAAYLDQNCSGDPDLRKEVESLLLAQEKAGSFLEPPAAGTAAGLTESVAADPYLGRQIGIWKVTERLGMGGMGVVYKARDTRLERDVALKFLRGELAGDRQALERFEREARAVSALNHPHICTIHAVDEFEGRPFMVMEFLEGQTLKERLGRGALRAPAGGQSPPLQLDALLDLAIQIAEGLESAHAKGIMHRDIKPGNIFVIPRGGAPQAKILDFGLAKPVHAGAMADEVLTQAGVAMGTVAYMSPEQARGKQLDARTDLFSFGAVLYEMATGQKAFAGDTAAVTFEAILGKAPVPAGQFNPELPAELARIIEKALEKDLKMRYQTAADLRADLERLKRESGSVRATAATKPARRTRWLLAFGGAVVMLAAVIALNVGGWRDRLLGRAGANAPEIHSLAVLPLENLSGDPQQEYFAEGMTEELTTDLAKISALRVISRISAMQYKATKKSLPQIAKELNVDAVIEGSVERSGDRVRITAQLIDAMTDRHLWAKTYETSLGDVLTLESQVAREVTEEVRAQLTPQERARLVRARPVNPEAYEYYLRAKLHHGLSNREDNAAAIDLLERAVAFDPNFAPAYADLAADYTIRFANLEPRQRQWEEKAFAAAQKALSLDPDLAEAYAARGNILWTVANHFPHERAVREVQHAIALNPNLAEAHAELALIYYHIGLLEKAHEELQKAIALDPLNSEWRRRSATNLIYMGNYGEALTAMQGSERSFPRLSTFLAALALFQLGRKDEASARVEEYLRAHSEEPDVGGLLSGMQALLAAAKGKNRRAEDKIQAAVKIGQGFQHFHHTAYVIASAYSLINKPDAAMLWLERTADEGFPCYPLFETDPNLNNLRQNPRFIEFMAAQKKQWEHFKATL